MTAGIQSTLIQTTRRGHGYRIIRRVQLHQLPRQSVWQRLAQLLWPRLTPEAEYARQQRLSAIRAELHSAAYWAPPRP